MLASRCGGETYRAVFRSGTAVGAEGNTAGEPGRRSAAARVHLEMRVLPECADGDQHVATFDRDPFLGAAIGALGPHRSDQSLEIVPRRSGAEGAAQISSRTRVEAHQ